MPRWYVRFALVVLFVGALVPVGTATSTAAPTVDGREWRELFETTGLSWSEVASVCPTDGETACSGTVGGRDLTGWTWATAEQVRDLLDNHAPSLSADRPVVSGMDGFWGAISFLGVMRWTTYTSITYFTSEWTGGWTASRDAESGLPVSGRAGYSHALASNTVDGSIGLGTDVDAANSNRGVFLWRPAAGDNPAPDDNPAAGDSTAPVVTPEVAGTLGNNGWYRSDVSVYWTVTDDESPIASREGCDPSMLTVDVAENSYACTATSSGGPGSRSVTVKRDTNPPDLSCAATPTFTLGQPTALVRAVVTDSLSGAVAASISRPVSTAVAGVHSTVLTAADRAGNSASRSCDYSVVVPTCQGVAPTIVGTGGNDVITGTEGADVIHALGGADRIDGLGAGDKLCGGDGADVIKGGDGGDRIKGGSGNDNVYGGGAADVLDGGAGSDSIRGEDGADRCTSGEVRMASCAVLN